MNGSVSIDDAVVDAEALDSKSGENAGGELAIDGYSGGDLSGSVERLDYCETMRLILLTAGDDDVIKVSVNGNTLEYTP